MVSGEEGGWFLNPCFTFGTASGSLTEPAFADKPRFLKSAF
jgi:hypothetical protein